MTAQLRLSALALAAALAACGDDTASAPGLLLSEPSDVAVFRGLTSKSSVVQPYLAIANAGSNDLTIVDARDDSMVPAPVPLRNLVFPVGQRPALLAAAELGDGGPDLLVAVSAGDRELQVIRTWDPAGGVATTTVDMGGDILALVPVPFDPGAPTTTARIAAALSGNRIAVAEFQRNPSEDPDADDIVLTGFQESGDLGFQPVDLAAMPGDPRDPDDPGDFSRIWAASRERNGVVEISVPGLVETNFLDASAPTRLVAAAQLAAERPTDSEDALDPLTWGTIGAPVKRVYAILDESGCGDVNQIPCGLVALDADGTGLAPDFVDPLGTTRAPIPIPGRALALAASGPPAAAPTSAPNDQAPFMRIWPGTGLRRTTGVAGVASSDGSLYFVDLGRWEIPSNSDDAASGTPVRVDPQVVVSPAAIEVTSGFTPTARWRATYQGELPGLRARRVEIVSDTAFALQAPGGGEAVDVALAGIASGDIVVITDPSPVGTCAKTFERQVETVGPSSTLAVEPGLEPETCTSARAVATDLRATVHAGEWVLVRGTGVDATVADRQPTGARFEVTGPRIGYVPEQGDPPDGPVLAFTIVDPDPATTVTRGAFVDIDTTEGGSHFRVQNAGVGPRAVVPFDRSTVPGREGSGVRFFVPYSSGVVLDASPSASGGGAATLR